MPRPAEVLQAQRQHALQREQAQFLGRVGGLAGDAALHVLCLLQGRNNDVLSRDDKRKCETLPF